MFYTCSSSCSNPAHNHGSSDSAEMMATSATKKASVSSKGTAKTAAKKAPAKKVLAPTQTMVKNKKGQHLVVDIHCHYLNPEVNAKTAHLNAPCISFTP